MSRGERSFDRDRPRLGQVIRSFKSQVTRKMRSSGYVNFSWQRGYYDHVTRFEKVLGKIREYIRTNPMRWHLDRYNPNAEGIDEDAMELWDHLKGEYYPSKESE